MCNNAKLKLRIMNRKFPTTKYRNAKKWNCPLISRAGSCVAQDNDTCTLIKIYISHKGSLLFSLCPRSSLLMQQESIYLFKENLSIFFTQDPHLTLCLRILHNFVYSFGKFVIFGIFLGSNTCSICGAVESPSTWPLVTN
jgi:hypothetical protein